MATIPLPALHTAPIAQPTSPLEMYGQLMGIKNAQQEQQARAQQMQQQQAMAPLQQQQAQQTVQSGQMDIEAKQRAANDQKAMSAVMQQWGKAPSAAPSVAAKTGSIPDPQTGEALGGSAATVNGPAAAGVRQGTSANPMPSYDDLVPLAIKNGASFTAVQGLQAHILDMKAKASTIAKDDAQAGTANADAMRTKNGMISDAMTGVMSLPDDQLQVGILRAAQELYGKGLFDPQHLQQAQQLAQLAYTDPKQARQQLNIQNLSLGAFSKELENQQKQLANQKEAGSMDPQSPFYAPSPAAVAMGTAPGAAQINAGEVKQAARKAGAEESARMPGEMALAAQRQALSQGDPNAAAQLLVNGDATLSELKSRGATPDFIEKSLTAAHRLSGGQYNAQSADAQFSVAKSPANVQFFGSAKSLTDKGGTLDQLAQAAQGIPAHQLQVLNSVADWQKAQTGSGPIAKYAALTLGVADDYSKVMGGGQGSDASRLQAQVLAAAKQSPEQRAGSIEGIRGAVSSQMNSRIGSNRVLQRMYGQSGGQQPGQQQNSNDPFAQFGGKAH
jgi:hypothetical protein